MTAETEPLGPWLVARFAPASLFSLKASFASSSVGTTLVVPTPYAVKMALVDAAFRRGDSYEACAELLQGLVGVEVRISPPEAVVTHTFTKIRQEPKKADPMQPYISNVAYRELAAQVGEWRWAFRLPEGSGLEHWLRELLPHVRYIGKRGSFIQFLGCEVAAELDGDYTVPLRAGGPLNMPPRAHVVPLDDFGPEASLKVLSSFSPEKAKRDRHRIFVQTVVPLGRTRTGPGFTEYRR